MERTVSTATIVVTIVSDGLAEANQRVAQLGDLLRQQPGVAEATTEAAVTHHPESCIAAAARERAR